MQVARLEGFYWVARASGYATAARAFPYPITQSALFQQVRKLEDDLGVRLFERIGKADDPASGCSSQYVPSVTRRTTGSEVKLRPQSVWSPFQRRRNLNLPFSYVPSSTRT